MGEEALEPDKGGRGQDEHEPGGERGALHHPVRIQPVVQQRIDKTLAGHQEIGRVVVEVGVAACDPMRATDDGT